MSAAADVMHRKSTVKKEMHWKSNLLFAFSIIDATQNYSAFKEGEGDYIK